MSIPRNTDFTSGMALSALFLNRVQEIISTFMIGTELSMSGQIVTLSCGTGSEASVLAISGKLRYSESNKSIDFTALGNATYGLWAVTTSNDSDPTYTFVQSTGTPGGTHVRKIGEVVKSGGVLTALKQFGGYEKHAFMHAVGSADPLANGSVTLAMLSSVVTDAMAPAGVMIDYVGTAAPAGWLMCDGSVVLRTDYAALFAAIGTGYNTGGESGTQFRLPDHRGRAEYGKGTHADVDTLGDSDGNAVGSRTPVHVHTFAAHGHSKGSLAVSGGSHTHAQDGVGTHVHIGDSYYFDGFSGFGDSSPATWSVGGGFTLQSAGGHAHTINAATHSHANSDISGNVGPNTNGDSALDTSAQTAAQKIPYLVVNRIIKT